MAVVVSARGLSRVYPGPPEVLALIDGTLDVAEGEKVAIIGPSGSGKSTLLNLLGLLDEPTAGEYSLLGNSTRALSSGERDRLRAESIGFIFQAYHVLSHRTARENVELKLSIFGMPREARPAVVETALDAVGLSHRGDALGRDLSGGEKQRLAIARAIAVQPRVLLADEPTGNLDRANADRIECILNGLADMGIAVITITHDERVAAWSDRVLKLSDGLLSST